MSGSALVPLGDLRGAVVAVPVEALQRLEQGWCVFLPRAAAGRVRGPARRPRARARRRGRGRLGLRAGETVVVDGAFLLKAEADKSRGGGHEHHH